MNCPHCSAILAESPELSGQIVACPVCRRQFALAPEAPPAAQVRAAGSYPFRHQPRGQGKAILAWGMMVGLLLALTFSFASIWVSQYWPLFGGFLTTIAEPWSKARMHYMPHHIIAGAFAGLALGGIFGASIRYLVS